MPELRLDDAQLAAALGELGQRIAWPPAPDVRARVLARIEARPRRTPWWRVALWSPRYGFAPVIATVALALAAVLVFSPQARATATEILRLRGVQIFQGPVPTPSPAPTRSPGATPTPAPSVGLGLGTPVSIDEARARAGYPIVVPADPLLGPPDEIYLRAVGTSNQVAFVYRVRAGIPQSREAGIAALVSEVGGGTVDEQFFGKVIGGGTTLEKLSIDGEPGFWIEGTPHFFFYATGSGGQTQQENLRLAGNTLIWQHRGLLLRLEAQVDKATALRIAASVR